MTEEIKPMELEDDALEAVSGGKIVADAGQPHMPLRDFGKSKTCMFIPSQWEPLCSDYNQDYCHTCKWKENPDWQDSFCNRFGC